jgi:hypothetical protein
MVLRGGTPGGNAEASKARAEEAQAGKVDVHEFVYYNQSVAVSRAVGLIDDHRLESLRIVELR